MNYETIISVLFGGLIIWVVAWFYYKKAGDQLIVESKKLKQTSDLLLYKLQYPDALTELERDENGDVVGLFASMEAKLKNSKKFTNKKVQ